VIRRLAELRRSLLISAFFRNTVALISGTVVTQAIVFLASPVLSRIFGLEDFGNLANFNAWVAVLALVSNLRYEHAIIVARGRKYTSRVMALTALLSAGSFMVYSVAAVAIFFLYHGGGYLTHLRTIVLMIPAGVLAVTVTSLFIQYNVKRGKFKLLATVTATQVVFTLIPQVVLGELHVRNALIFGTIAGYLFSAVVLGWFFAREVQLREMRRGLRRTHLLATAREHINFPRYTLAADAITVIAQQFIPVFVLALFNPAVAGLYAFSIRVVRVPLIVVSTAVAGSLRKEAIDRVHERRSLVRLFAMTVRTLALMAVVPFIGVLLFAQPIFAFVFGNRWADAGHLVQILSPGILFEFIALPLAGFFLVTNTQRYTLAIQFGGFVLLVAALFTGKHYFGDFTATCYLVSGVMVTVHLVSILLAGKVARAHGTRVEVAGA
jgi:O-antigen/teichoic acid export membrane protein